MTSPPSSGAAAQSLRAAGLRVTAPRLAVLEELLRGGHVSAEHVTAAVRVRLGAVSTQAVYDVLHAFVASGLAARVEPAGSPAARFEARTRDNHHHVVCRSCGAVADVDCAVGAAPCLEPAATHGFVIDQAEVTYWGLCPACQANPQPPLEGAPS
ncbi:MAG: transcriptional repressor [Actinomycetota bacterium]|nr:transcriptional repressor [Actinomycetota bacterium]